MNPAVEFSLSHSPKRGHVGALSTLVEREDPGNPDRSVAEIPKVVGGCSRLGKEDKRLEQLELVAL